MTGLRRGHDVNYFNASRGGGCAGAMAYYTKGGEPPGQWYGRGADRVGLSGQVDPAVISRLYMKNISPAGEQLAKPPKMGDEDRSDAAVAAAMRKWKRGHPYASATEIQQREAEEHAKAGPRNVPYFDLTISAVKSVSVLHASYRVAAMQARSGGATARADYLDGRAATIEQALMDAARDAVDWIEREACYTRTGYHSDTTGEWRDGDGLTAALFLHHLSRDGDPQLHVHVALWNRVQRADAVDEMYRTLYGRALFRRKLAVAPVPDRFVEARLREQGFVMVPREDGNGCEVGGVSEHVMKRFSSRGVAVAGKTADLAAQYERVHKHPPSRRTLWLLHQEAGQRTRRSKAEARRTVGGKVRVTEPSEEERLAEWEAQTTTAEMAALSSVHLFAEQFARDRSPVAPERVAAATAASEIRRGNVSENNLSGPLPPVPGRVLSDADRRRAARIAVAQAQKKRSAWGLDDLRFEIHRALGAGVTDPDITEIADLVASGRSGCPVAQVGDAPDVADVQRTVVHAGFSRPRRARCQVGPGVGGAAGPRGRRPGRGR
jgi:hypothetical protein